MQPAIASSRFQILRRLGEGGMGTVYEALDAERNERVAMKVLRRAGPEAIVRFKREFRSLQDLHHPNLVTLRELVSEGDALFFTMELVDGEDFVSWVTDPGSGPASGSGPAKGTPFGFDERRLRSALAQLALGLSALHDAQKVHRDVKPSNVLVDRSGRVVVLDFGLITDTQEHASMMTDPDVVGTPAYMAPEQGASRAVGPAADWYSVGCMLYEALTGEVPFSGAPLEVLLRKQRDEPRPPSALAPDIPPDLDELCASLLRFDPSARPTGRKVLRALDAIPRAAESASLPSISLAVPFVGRETELRELGEAYARSRSGAVTVLVRGESGIGKTCLVRHFTEALQSQDKELLLLNGRCFERETMPYKALDGVVDALASFLGRLRPAEAATFLPTRPGPLVQVFPVLKRVEVFAHLRGPSEPMADRHELRARAFGAMRELLARIASRRPLVIVIDDLQWADADSFTLLDEILRPPEEPTLLLIATLREEDALGPAKGPLAPTANLPGDVRQMTVPRLGPEDSRLLAARLVERISPGLPVQLESLASEADGHPLFIDEIVRHLFLVGGTHGALKLEDALWSRIASLEDAPRRIVEVCAIAGSPLPQEAVCKAVEVTPAEFARLTSFLRVAHLIRTTGTRGTDLIECFHGRVREAVASHLTPEGRKAHHLRLALALESSAHPDPDLLAIHWLGAGEIEAACKHTLAAAARANTALAFERAARLYGRALKLQSESPRKVPRAEERALQTKLGEALANAGRGAQAAHAYRDACAGANDAEALELRRLAADQLLRSGHFDEGLEAVHEVLAAVGMRLPRTPLETLLALVFWRIVLAIRGMRYRLVDASYTSARDLTRIDVCYTVALSLALVDPICGQLFQTRNILASLRAGEPGRVSRALAIEVSYRGMAGGKSWKRTSALDVESRQVAREVGTPHSVAWAMATSGVAHYLSGRFEEAFTICSEAEPIFVEQCSGAFYETGLMRMFVIQSLAHLGRYAEMRARQAAALRVAMDHGDLYAVTNLRIGNPNLVWLADGDSARARRECTEAMTTWSKLGFQLEHYYEMLALANADLYEGKARDAAARLEASHEASRRAHLLRVQMVRMTFWMLEGRAALGMALDAQGSERDALVGKATRAARRVAAEQMPWGAAMAALLVAGAAKVRGDDGSAIRALEDCLRAAEAVKLGTVAASARYALGACKGGSEGKALTEGALARLSAAGAKAPERLVAMTAAGFLR
jgi:tetratricopeptide (TPR) repeat protein